MLLEGFSLVFRFLPLTTDSRLINFGHKLFLEFSVVLRNKNERNRFTRFIMM